MKIIVKKSTGEIESQIEVVSNRPILKQLEEAWVEMHSACHAGICWACICTIEKWVEHLNKAFVTEPGFPLAEEEVMTCIGAVTSWDGEIILQKIY